MAGGVVGPTAIPALSLWGLIVLAVARLFVSWASRPRWSPNALRRVFVRRRSSHAQWSGRGRLRCAGGLDLIVKSEPTR
ncbi:MAG: hypothetical protein AB7H19_08980 [Porticoccaceae bacterium]